MKNDNIFKKGDRVFHFVFGWGSVTGDSEKGVCDVVFENRESVAIPCKETHLSFCKYDLINGGLSHNRPFELEVGKSYFRNMYNKIWIVVNRVNNDDNYGFIDGKWEEKIPCSDHRWREATDEEVRNALLEETIRRYGENWEDVKIVKSIGMVPYGDNDGEFDVEIKEYSSSGWVVWNKNGCLFKKGVWAEKLEEPEFEIFQKVLVRDGQSNSWRIDLFSNTTGNNDYPYRCMTGCWSQCIPYEGNEHLLSTTKSPEK